jgi:hypothetical protein
MSNLWHFYGNIRTSFYLLIIQLFGRWGWNFCAPDSQRNNASKHMMNSLLPFAIYWCLGFQSYSWIIIIHHSQLLGFSETLSHMTFWRILYIALDLTIQPSPLLYPEHFWNSSVKFIIDFGDRDVNLKLLKTRQRIFCLVPFVRTKDLLFNISAFLLQVLFYSRPMCLFLHFRLSNGPLLVLIGSIPP